MTENILSVELPDTNDLKKNTYKRIQDILVILKISNSFHIVLTFFHTYKPLQKLYPLTKIARKCLFITIMRS